MSIKISKYYLSAEAIKQSQDDIAKLYNHAKVANEEMGAVKIDLATVKTDVAWIKKFFWIVATSAIGSLGTGLLNLFR